MFSNEIQNEPVRRIKIWELPDTQCSIVGTCLSLSELRKIARKTGVELRKNVTEYELHGIFVGLCKEECAPSRAVNKLLDKKYERILRKFSLNKTTDELRVLWEESMQQGIIPGPYWALISHPIASAGLKAHVFGEVHMLSHAVGASNRGDIKRLRTMEKDLATTQERLEQVKCVYRKRTETLSEENATLKQTNSILRQELEAGREQTDTVSDPMLFRANALLQKELETLRQRTELLEKRVLELEAGNTALERENAEQRAELELMENEMERAVSAAPEAACNCEYADRCTERNLCGKCILYVGGRTNLIKHYRMLVEKYGGQFLHHDGGVETSSKKLQKILPKADAVLFPVDCVSHEASLFVKNACKHCDKPCYMLRSSGLSSLTRTLGDLTDSEAEQSYQ